MNIILSIHPEYVEKILAGEKTVELRRLLPRQNVEKIYIYSTSPVKKIVGYFTGRRFDYNMNFANMIEINKKACVNGFWMYDYFHDCNVIIPIWRDEGRENAANN